MNNVFAYPIHYLMRFEPISSVVLKHFPDARDFDKTVTFNDLIEKSEDKEELKKEILAGFQAYFDAMQKEADEFGVHVNPNGPRYLWGSEEINENVVKMIEAQYPINEGDVLFYGPSNITFWYSLEQDMLPYHAQNHGMGGCIDPDLIKYAPRLLFPYKPSVVFFQTGSNDLANGIPLETILANKKKMYDYFLGNMPNAKLVVCSGLPLPGRTEFWPGTVKTNELLKKLCEETDRLYFMDATDKMLTDHGPAELATGDGRYFNRDLYRMDEIHLNKKGHDVWTALMKEKLKEIR